MSFSKVVTGLIWVTLSLWIGYFAVFWLQGYIFKPDGSVWAKSLGTWADGAAHLTYISAMAYRLPQYSPVYLGKSFTYPFVADMLSAILVRLGINIFLAYSLVGLFLSVLLVLILFRVYQVIYQQNTIAWVSVNLFLLSGGLGMVKFFKDYLESGSSVITAIPQEYTLIEDWHIRWINIVTAELIPQRAFLLALPLGLYVIWWLWKMYTGKIKTKYAIVAGIIFGLMPLVHVHTYIVLSIVTAWIFLIAQIAQFQKIKKLTISTESKQWLMYGVLAACISLPIIYGHILPATDASFIRWYPGWLAKSMQVNWLWWWFVNTGFFWPLAVIGWLHFSKQHKLFSVGFWLVFIISNLVLFQPYDWDNAKLLTWAILGLSPAVSLALYKFWRTGFLFKVLSLVLFLSLTVTGFIDVVRQLQPHVSIPMYSKEELELVDWIKSNTSLDSIFLTGQVHTHPVPALTGRQIVMGYQGWLWSYGIDYGQREVDIKLIYQSANQRLIEKYLIDYIIIGPDERSRFNPDENLFRRTYPLVKKTANFEIYQID